MCLGQGIVFFNEIPLGIDYKIFAKTLRHDGFRKYMERDDEDDLFYGYCLEGFYRGKYDGNPAVVKVTSSQKTRKVFNVELILKGFVDAMEAAQAADRLLADMRIFSQIIMPAEINWDMRLVELPGGKKRTYKAMCFLEAEKLWYLYANEKEAQEKSHYGVADIGVLYNRNEREYLVKFYLYDSASGKIAEDEAGKFNGGKQQ